MDDDCLYFGGHIYNLSRITQYFKYQSDMIERFKRRVEELDRNNPGMLDTVLSRGHL